MSIPSEHQCDHLIGRNARDSGHGSRPVGEQICLKCKKTLESIMQDYAIEARIDELKNLPVNWESCYDNTLRKHYSKVYDDVYNQRLKELEQLRTTNQTSKGEE